MVLRSLCMNNMGDEVVRLVSIMDRLGGMSFVLNPV